MNCENLKGKRVGCVMTGSFCTFGKAFDAWRRLRDLGAELYPIMSPNAASLDTRFYAAKDAKSIFSEITGRDIWTELTQTEPIGPKNLLDLVVIAPCTGNTIAKMASGITDNAAVMAAKSHLRNGKPVLIAVSTNDGLGRSAENIGALMNMRGVFLVPFGQDDPFTKPDSLTADFSLIPEAASMALSGRRYQPQIHAFQRL